MADQDKPDPQFDAMTARLLHREALRRAADELNTTTGPGLEGVLARISAEVTSAAAGRVSATTAEKTGRDAVHSGSTRQTLRQRPTKS